MAPSLHGYYDARERSARTMGHQEHEYERLSAIGILGDECQSQARILLQKLYNDIVTEKFGPGSGSQGEIRIFCKPSTRRWVRWRLEELLGEFRRLGCRDLEQEVIVENLYQILRWNRAWFLILREQGKILNISHEQRRVVFTPQTQGRRAIEERRRLDAAFAYLETAEESNQWNDEWLVRFNEAGGFDFLEG
ncbi:uncharacterized protein N7511_003891 [Penicillium nucicola]|uniref:uncharacterized protein n=1 Tax=Penicillium nucicola TaxID=1850975 RepID=UPI0025454762|nr:uncharacterized protein N7511_003891 [Penicillium nucicola]KAJ5766275.1 hypothetical protein N7511_003891 [Penicillium nucicola]